MACVRCVSPPVHRETRSFPTTTSGLRALGAWLGAQRCTQLAREATGVYWRPVWHMREGRFELVLANAQHIKNLPGRTSDVNDATLVTAAWAAVWVKRSYLHAQVLRLKARRGANKAILAVAASMLTAIYFMLRNGVPYRDLGPQHFDERQRSRTIRRLLRRLHDLGCPVTTAGQFDASTVIASAS